MDAIIISKDQGVAARVRDCLVKKGYACSCVPTLNVESVKAMMRSQSPAKKVLILVASPSFSTGELADLHTLCSDLQEQAKVVAVGASQSTEAILRVIRCGAMDYLVLNGDFESELSGFVTRLQSARNDATPPGKLISIISPVGGSGVSMLASNLAAVLAKQEKSCALLDVHFCGGDLANLLGLTARHTLASLASKSQQLDAIMFEQSLLRHESGIQLLPSTEPFSEQKGAMNPVLHKVVQFAKSQCRFVIADIEDLENSEQFRVLVSSERVIVVFRAEVVSLFRTMRCLEMLNQCNVPHDRVTLVVNRSGQPGQLSRGQIAEILNKKVSHYIPDDPAAVNASFNVGIPVSLASPTSKVAQNVTELANSIRGQALEPAPGPRPVSWRTPLSSMSQMWELLPRLA